jgi:hypothetical protein
MAGVRRLALEVGRGTNITIPGTKFPVFEHMPNSFFVPVTTFLLDSHVAAVAFRVGLVLLSWPRSPTPVAAMSEVTMLLIISVSPSEWPSDHWYYALQSVSLRDQDPYREAQRPQSLCSLQREGKCTIKSSSIVQMVEPLSTSSSR